MNLLTRIVHFSLAILPIIAIGYDIFHESPSLVNYFSLFTTLSNLIAAFLFLYLTFAKSKKNSMIDSFRGATVGYLLTSSAVYFLLVKNTIGPPPVVWVNIVLHKIMPIAVFLDWIIFPPRKHLSLSKAFGWLLFPLVYVVYLLVRGQIVNWHPYPFLDPNVSGYGPVFAYIVAIVIFGLLLASFLIILGNKLGSLKNN